MPIFLSPDMILPIVAGSVLLLLVSVFVVSFVALYQRKKQNLQAQFAQTLLQSQLEIQENTLNYVAKELHDNLGITASLVKINLNTIDSTRPEAIPGKIAEAKENVMQLIADIKALSVQLDGDQIKRYGLWTTIRQDLERIKKTGVFNTSYTQQEGLPELDPGKATILYRMVQELLNNALKHSRAKNIIVNTYIKGNLLILDLSDDGCGFDWEAKKLSGGAGLLNLTGRANLIHATLDFKSTAGSGTTATITLPLS